MSPSRKQIIIEGVEKPLTFRESASPRPSAVKHASTGTEMTSEELRMTSKLLNQFLPAIQK